MSSSGDAPAGLDTEAAVGVGKRGAVAYRQGVRVGTVGLVASTSAAVILPAVGARFFGEQLTWAAR